MAMSNVDVRRARKFLHGHGIKPSVISPRRFATAASELGKTFSDLLALIRRLASAGQGQGQAPIAKQIAEKS